jgi:DNA-damage-inducible protein J
MTTSTINLKIDTELKEQFQQLAKDLGASTTTLITMFVKRAVDERGIPFEVKAKPRLTAVHHQLIAEENAKILGLIPDDAAPLEEDFFDKATDLYK